MLQLKLFTYSLTHGAVISLFTKLLNGSVLITWEYWCKW